MKNVFKLLLLPISMMCCSMKINGPSVSINAFCIYEEHPQEGYLLLDAWLDFNIKDIYSVCYYDYYWKGSNGVENPCGSGGVTSVDGKPGHRISPSNRIQYNTLDNLFPITFICQAELKGEIYRSYLTYNTKTINDFTISEATNNQYQSTGYVKESTFFDHNLDYHYEDTFVISNFEDLRVNELYYDIDISYIRFKYHNGLDNVLNGTFTFAFYDTYNLFPDFEGGESLYRYIPLKLNKDKDEWYFTFAPTIYYDPITHESSLIKKNNYIPHDKLMLPFNAANNLKMLPCYIELKVHGHTDFTIKGKFVMTYLKKYYGDKEDSRFYEEIHQDEEINIRERVEEITI